MNDRILILYNFSSDEQLQYAFEEILLLSTLVIEHCFIEENSAAVIGNLIKSCSNCNQLERIVIVSCSTRTQKFNILQSICFISALLHLELRGNVLTTEAAEALALIILNNYNKLKNLHLADNHLQLDVIKVITNALKNNSSLETLYMEENKIPAEAVNLLADAIKGNTSLKELSLSNNSFGSSIVNDLTKHQALKNSTCIAANTKMIAYQVQLDQIL